MKVIGKKTWAIPGCYIPLESTGKEPEFTSHDKISVFNTSGEEAEIEIFIFYEDKEPVGPYPLKVKAGKLRKFRFNDLINPEAIPLETNFGFVLKSNVPVVVQYSRQNTGSKNVAEMSTMAFPIK